MKKAVTAVVLFTLWVTPALTVTAQKTRSFNRKVVAAPNVEATETVFDNVQAFSDGSGVLLRWTMKDEVSNLGFDVYRLDSKVESRVTSDIVLGAATRFHATAVSGQSYEYFVPGGDPEGGVYFVEAIAMNGQRTRSGGIVPTIISNLDLVSKRPIIDHTAGVVESQRVD